MSGTHVTAVINAHSEGLIARSSLLSASRAKAHAEARGFKVEVIVVLDRADVLTMEVVKGWQQAEFRIICVDNGDLGRSRNDGVAASCGEWIAFLDADDLWSETWVSSALEAAARDKRNVVWHPEVNIFFGSSQYIFRHIDMEAEDFDPLSLCAGNYWTALCMAKRDLLIAVPYQCTDLANKIGYEDWHWNMATIGHGAIHKVVRGTGHAIRTRPRSLVKRTAWLDAIPKPNRDFRTFLFANRKHLCGLASIANGQESQTARSRLDDSQLSANASA